MRRVFVFTVLALLVLGDVAAVVSAQLPPAVRTVESTAGIRPGTTDAALRENRSDLNRTGDVVLESRLIYSTGFDLDTGEWTEVKLDGDTNREPLLWRRATGAGPDNSSAFVATSGITGTLPAGVDRALEGPIFDLRYMRAKGGLVTNATDTAHNETLRAIDDLWTPVATEADRNLQNQLRTFSQNLKARLNPEGPLPESDAALSPTLGDVNLSFIHRYNFSNAFLHTGEYLDGSRLEIRLRGENYTWSRWVPLDPSMVKAVATATNREYNSKTLLSQLQIDNPSGNAVPPLSVSPDRPTPIRTSPNGDPIYTVPNLLGNPVPGTDSLCAFVLSARDILRAVGPVAGESASELSETFGGPALPTDTTNLTALEEVECEGTSDQPLNPGALIYGADDQPGTGDLYAGEYTGRVVRFNGDYGYTAASVNASGNLTWINSTYDLSPFVGYELQVRLRVASQPAPAPRGEGWSIDNMTLYGKVWPTDLGVRSVEFPAPGEVLSHTERTAVRATIRNYGANRIDNAYANLRVVSTNGTEEVVYFTGVTLGTLKPQEERRITFPAWTSIPPGDYRIEVTANFTPRAVTAQNGRPLTAASSPVVDVNPENDALQYPIYFRAGLVRDLAARSMSVTPAQDDVNTERTITLLIANEGNAPDRVNASLMRYDVNATTGKRIPVTGVRIAGAKSETKEILPYGTALTSTGSNNNTRTFTWTWTPASRGVYDLVATVYGQGTLEEHVIRAYVRASSIPYFSEDFNDPATLRQVDPDRLRTQAKGTWEIAQFPFAPSPHQASGAWLPDLSDSKVFVGLPDLSKGVVVTVPGAGSANPVPEPDAPFPADPAPGTVPPQYSCSRKDQSNPANIRGQRCNYEDAYAAIAGGYALAFESLWGEEGTTLVLNPSSINPNLAIPPGIQSTIGAGFSPLEYLYGGRMHYYLVNDVEIPDSFFDENTNESVRLTFWHASSMNPVPYDSPISARPQELVPAVKDASLTSSLGAGTVTGATDASLEIVDRSRSVLRADDPVRSVYREPLDEVYGRVLAYPGVVVRTGVGASLLNPTVPVNVPETGTISQNVSGVFVRYGDETATIQGTLAKAFDLAEPPTGEPLVLGYFNSTFTYQEGNFSIPAALLERAVGRRITIVFEYAIPPGRVHLGKTPAVGNCGPDPRRADAGGCPGSPTVEDLSELRERWIVDDIGVTLYKNDQPKEVLLYDNAEGKDPTRSDLSRQRPATLPKEWSSSGWTLRTWTNPYPALWHVDEKRGYVSGTGVAKANRALSWTNVNVDPPAYDDNTWSVLRSPAVDLSIASKPVLVFKHNFSFMVPNGAATPLYPPFANSSDQGVAFDGGNLRLRVLDEKTGVWGPPVLLGDAKTYTHTLYLDPALNLGETQFVRPGETPYVWSNLSDLDGDVVPDWREERFDLTDYRGKTVQFEWHAFSRSGTDGAASPLNRGREGTTICTRGMKDCSVGGGWFIDDVQVQEDRFANDIAILGMTSPEQEDTFIGPGTTLPVSVEIKNIGAYSQKGVRVNVTITRVDVRDAQGRFPVVYEGSKEMPKVDPITFKERALEVDATTVVGLPAWAVPNIEEARYRINVTTSLFDPRFRLVDDNPANDFLTREVTARSIRVVEIRNLTLDPPIGDRETRRVLVEVANVGNTVESFTDSGGLQVRYLVRRENVPTWTLIGTRTTEALGLKEVWRPRPILWTPEVEATYELKAEIIFGTNLDGTPRVLSTLTTARVLSSFLKEDAEAPLDLSDVVGRWGIRANDTYSGNGSYAFPATGVSYPGNADDTLRVGPVNLYAAESAILSFIHKYDFEEGYDAGVVEWSSDGTTWTPLRNRVDERLLTTASPLVENPSTPTWAYTGTKGEWTRATYDLGLERAFTKDDSILTLEPRDIGESDETRLWNRNFTELGNGTVWASPLGGAASGFSVTRVLDLAFDVPGVTPATADDLVVTYRDRHRTVGVPAGVTSFVTVKLLEGDTVRATLVPRTSEATLGNRGWATLRLPVDAPALLGKSLHLQFIHEISVPATAAVPPTLDAGWYVDDVRILVTSPEQGVAPAVVFPTFAAYDHVDYVALTAAAARGWTVKESFANLTTGAAGERAGFGWDVADRVDGMWRSHGQDVVADLWHRYLELTVDLTPYTLGNGYTVGELRYSDLRNLAPPGSGGGTFSKFSVRVLNATTGKVLATLLPEAPGHNDHYRDWTDNKLRLDLATYGGQRVKLQWVNAVRSAGLGQHPSADYGWFIDNVRVTATRAAGTEARVFPAFWPVDTIEYATVAEAQANGWNFYQVKTPTSQGGGGPVTTPLAGWATVSRVLAPGWIYDPASRTLSLPKTADGIKSVDSRVIFPIDLRAAADDVRLYMKGSFAFPQPQPGVPGVRGGGQIEVSTIAPGADPNEAPWEAVPLTSATTVGYGVWPVTGYTSFGTDRERNSDFGPGATALGGAYATAGDPGVSFNLTKWRGQKIWVALHAVTDARALPTPQWDVSSLEIRAQVLDAENVAFRFRAATDDSNNATGWSVDNVTLAGFKRSEGLGARFDNIPANSLLPGGTFRPAVIVENRGLDPVTAIVVVKLGKPGDLNPKIIEGTVALAGESVARLTRLGQTDIAFPVDAGTSPLGVDYELSVSVRAAPRSGEADTANYLTFTKTLAELDSAASNDYWNRAVTPRTAESPNKMWHLLPAHAPGRHRDYLNLTVNFPAEAPSPTTKQVLQWYEMRSMPPASADGFRVLDYRVNLYDVTSGTPQLLATIPVSLTETYSPQWRLRTADIPTATNLDGKRVRIEWMIETETTTATRPSFDLGWFIDDVELRLDFGAGATKSAKENMNSFTTPDGATNWTRAHVNVPGGVTATTVSRWTLSTGHASKGFAREGALLALRGDASKPADARFTFELNLAGLSNPILYLKQSYAFPTADGKPIGGALVEVTSSSDPRDGLDLFAGWLPLKPLGQAATDEGCNAPFSETSDRVYGPLGRVPSAPSIGHSGCVLSGSFGTAGARDEMAFDLRPFADRRVFVSLHGWLPAGATANYWLVEGLQVRYERPQSEKVDLRAVLPAFDRITVRDVEVSPNSFDRSSDEPLTVRATFRNDGSGKNTPAITLMVQTYNTVTNRLDNVSIRGLVGATFDGPREMLPGAYLNVTWTLPRDWRGDRNETQVYFLDIESLVSGVDGAKKSHGYGRFFEIKKGGSFFNTFAPIGSAFPLSPGTNAPPESYPRFANYFWWDTASTGAWRCFAIFELGDCKPPADGERRFYPYDPYDGMPHGLGIKLSGQSVTSTYNVATDTFLDLTAFEKAYVSFYHRYYFGKTQELPADPRDYGRLITSGQSGGWAEACLAFLGCDGASTNWTRIYPVGYDQNGDLVQGTYPGHVVSRGVQPVPPGGGSGGTTNPNYNHLVAESGMYRVPGDGPALHITDGYSGQSPGYGLDATNPEGWVPEVLDLSPFAGRVVYLRFRMGLTDGGEEATWLLDRFTVSPFLASVTPGQTLVLADGVTKGFRFTLRNDGSVTDRVLLVANRTAIPSNWGFDLPAEDDDLPLFVNATDPHRVVSLDPGESREVVLAMDIPIARAFESDRRSIIRATSLSDPLKSTALEFALRFKPRIWPDLSVEALRLGSETVMAENLIPVSVRVKNLGDVPAEGAKIRLVDLFLADPEDPDSAIAEEIPLLDAERDSVFRLGPFGSVREITFNWRPRFAGSHTLVALADPDLNVVEYSRANNLLRKSLVVVPPRESDVAVRIQLLREDGSPAEGEVIQGETVTALLTVENKGSADAQAVLASLGVSSPGGATFPLLPRDPFPVDGVIPPGDRRVIRTQWLADVPARYTLLASAFVSGGSIPERKGILPTGAGNYTDDNYAVLPVLVRSTGLKVTLGATEAPIAPGATVSVPFTLVNGGNGEDSILLDSETPEGFSAVPINGTTGIPEVLLPTKGSLQGVLAITAPPDALAGPAQVKLLARSERTGEIVTRTVTLAVAPRHDLRAAGRDLRAAPGDFVVEIAVENRGNVEERVSAVLVPGLRDARDLFAEADATEASIAIPAFGSGVLRLPVSVPERLTAGPYDLRVNVRSPGIPEGVTVPVRVRLTETAAAAILPAVPGATLATGDTLKTPLIVSNIGNVPVSLSLLVEEAPPLLAARLTDEPFALDVGKAESGLVLDLAPAREMPPGRYDVVLAAVAEDGARLGTYRFPLDVSGVDFVLTDLTYTPRAGFTPGTDLRVTATVENRGSLPAKAVPVAFYVDGHLVNYTEVPAMAPFSNATVDFRWTALEGAHVLWVSVDPHQTLGEADITNNVRVHEVDGGRVEEGVFGGFKVPAPGGALAALSVLALAALARVARRGKEGRKP